jgi:hypothetical protein
MRLQGIQGRSARIYRRSRVSQKAFFSRFPNSERQVPLTAANQVWVADVTYIRVAGRWRYLAVVMDQYSRRILRWSVSPHRDSVLTRRALVHAVHHRKPPAGVVFHSDRGIEYAAHDVGRSLSEKGFLTRRARCAYSNLMRTATLVGQKDVSVYPCSMRIVNSSNDTCVVGGSIRAVGLGTGFLPWQAQAVTVDNQTNDGYLNNFTEFEL